MIYLTLLNIISNCLVNVLNIHNIYVEIIGNIRYVRRLKYITINQVYTVTLLGYKAILEKN